MMFSHSKAIRELNDSTKSLENGQKKILEAIEARGRMADLESSSSGASSILRKFDVAAVVSSSSSGSFLALV